MFLFESLVMIFSIDISSLRIVDWQVSYNVKKFFLLRMNFSCEGFNDAFVSK